MTSQNFIEQVYKQETGYVFLHLIDVYIVEEFGGEPSLYHYVDDYVPLEFDTGDGVIIYQPAAFKTTFGSNESEGTPTVNLSFDAGDRDVIRRLRRSEEPPVLQISMVMSPNDANHVVTTREFGPIELEISDFNFKSTAIEASLRVEPFFRRTCSFC